MLTPDFRKTLAAKAHTLSPVVRIGQKGLTDAVHLEIDAAFKAHELIKIKISEAEIADKRAMIELIKTTHQAELIQAIGHVAVFYRTNPEKRKGEVKKKR